MTPDPCTWQLPAPLQRRVDNRVQGLLQPPGGGAGIDFSRPLGEPALLGPDSLSWQVFKNPLTVFLGGVAAAVLELAEPRVRSGVWEHTRFREQPLGRMARTGRAAMVTVYGAHSQAEAMIARISRLHRRVSGTTPEGQSYRALDPDLLGWVHATASFGFLEAYCTWVRPLDEADRDRFHREGRVAARLYGASAAPGSKAAVEMLFRAWAPRLQASGIVLEFLRIMERLPALPWLLRPVQPLLIRGAVELVPAALRERLGLGPRWVLAAWQRRALQRAARAVDGLLLSGSAPVQACRRLGLPDDYLYRHRRAPVSTPGEALDCAAVRRPTPPSR